MSRIFAAAAIVAGRLGCAPPQAPQLPAAASGRTAQATVFGARDMVAAANRLAVDAGAATLARGGSAVDAAIAVQMVLNLVEPQSSGIGGGGFLMHHAGRSGRLKVYDGRETAPAEATADLLIGPDGQALRKRDAIDGGLSVGTPGLLRMLELAHRDHGRLPWPELFAPAIALAERGFPMSPRLAAAVAAAAPRLCREPAARAYFLEPGGCSPKAAGARLVNPEFAQTLRAVARDGADALHRGPLAEAIVEAVRAHPMRPGRLSLADLEAYRARVRAPVCGPYRGFTVCGVPPPSSGGITLLQVLGILERFELSAHPPDAAETVHLVTEAYRLAYADRARHLADDDFVAIPVAGLLSADYLRSRAAMVRPDRSLGTAPAGAPAGSLALGDDRSETLPSTTHLSIVDADGNAVANTYTLNFSYGVGMVAEGTGVLLNNELDDFAAKAGVPNGFGLIGGDANAPAPGKRPLSSMSPTFVLKDGQIFMVTGSPGGSRIITTVVQVISNVIDHGMNVQEAVSAPRIHHQWLPDELRTERGLSIDTVRILESRGHKVVVAPASGSAQTIMVTPRGLAGAADTRQRGTLASGY